MLVFFVCTLLLVCFWFVFFLIFFRHMMHVSLLCLCVLKVASIDGLMPFLIACHCTIFIVNLLFCFILGK